jgi:hypothetical protein
VRVIFLAALAIGIGAVAACGSATGSHSPIAAATPVEHSSSPPNMAAAASTPTAAAATPTPLVLPSFAKGNASIFFGNDVLTQFPKNWTDRTADQSFAAANGIPSTDYVELLLQGPHTGAANTGTVIFIVQLPANDYQDPSQFEADITGGPGFHNFQVVSMIPLTVGGDSGLAVTVTFSTSDGRTVKEWSVLVDHTPTGGDPTTYLIELITSPAAFATQFPVAEEVVGSLSWLKS